MSLDFNVGEISSRLRRALGVRGRIPLDVDERVVPTLLAQNLDEAPFRLIGTNAHAALPVTFAGAQASVGFFIGPTGVGVRTTNLVVTELAAASTLAAQVRVWRMGAVAALPSPFGSQPLIEAEQPVLPPVQIPYEIIGQTSAAVPAGSQLLWYGEIGAASTVQIPVGALLNESIFGLLVQLTAAYVLNARAGCSVRARYWPERPA